MNLEKESSMSAPPLLLSLKSLSNAEPTDVQLDDVLHLALPNYISIFARGGDMQQFLASLDALCASDVVDCREEMYMEILLKHLGPPITRKDYVMRRGDERLIKYSSITEVVMNMLRGLAAIPPWKRIPLITCSRQERGRWIAFGLDQLGGTYDVFDEDMKLLWKTRLRLTSATRPADIEISGLDLFPQLAGAQVDADGIIEMFRINSMPIPSIAVVESAYAKGAHFDTLVSWPNLGLHQDRFHLSAMNRLGALILASRENLFPRLDDEAADDADDDNDNMRTQATRGLIGLFFTKGDDLCLNMFDGSSPAALFFFPYIEQLWPMWEPKPQAIVAVGSGSKWSMRFFESYMPAFAAIESARERRPEVMTRKQPHEDVMAMWRADPSLTPAQWHLCVMRLLAAGVVDDSVVAAFLTDPVFTNTDYNWKLDRLISQEKVLELWHYEDVRLLNLLIICEKPSMVGYVIEFAEAHYWSSMHHIRELASQCYDERASELLDKALNTFLPPLRRKSEYYKNAVMTPLMLAALIGNEEVVKKLLTATDTDVRAMDDTRDAVHYAKMGRNMTDMSTMRDLIPNAAQRNERIDSYGRIIEMLNNPRAYVDLVPRMGKGRRWYDWATGFRNWMGIM